MTYGRMDSTQSKQRWISQSGKWWVIRQKSHNVDKLPITSWTMWQSSMWIHEGYAETMLKINVFMVSSDCKKGSTPQFYQKKLLYGSPSKQEGFKNLLSLYIQRSTRDKISSWALIHPLLTQSVIPKGFLLFVFLAKPHESGWCSWVV